MSKKLQYNNSVEKFLGFLLGVTSFIWVPLHLFYTSIANHGIKEHNKYIAGD